MLTATVSYACLHLLLGVTACKHEPFLDDDASPGPIDTTGNVDTTDTIPTGNPCDPDSVYFEADILPIFRSNCAMSGCHDAASAQEGVVLNSFANILSTGDVKPFDPDNSEVYEVLTEDDPDKRMPPPPAAPLSQAQLEQIGKWIQQGAQNLSCDPNPSGCDTLNVSYAATLKPVIETHCKGCHSGANPSGGIDLSTYDGVKVVALDGRLYGAVSWAPSFKPMPQGGNKLPDCTVSKFKSWIDAGAPEN